MFTYLFEGARRKGGSQVTLHQECPCTKEVKHQVSTYSILVLKSN